MFSHFVLRRKYLPDDSNKIQDLFSFSVSDFETWLGFKIRSRAIRKRLRLPSEPLLNNFSIGKWPFNSRFKIWCKGWGGWYQFHSQTDIILVLTYLIRGKNWLLKKQNLIYQTIYEDSKNEKFMKIIQQEVGSLLMKCILELLPILFGDHSW